MLSMRDDAGDSAIIPIGPVESYSERPLVEHHDKGSPIDAYFVFHEVIGEGGFSTVRKATCKSTGETYAVKVVDKSKIQDGDFPRVILEIETLASMKHPYICKLYSVFYTRTKIYMVMEYCYTDLFEYLVKLSKPLPESEARRIFIQLLSAVSYLHSMGVVHRDIKPENILLTGNTEIRLSDFGLASIISRPTEGSSVGQLLYTYCGSPAYCAPEIVLGIPYCGAKADIWSLGVNLYVLLANELPFWAKTPNEVKTRIISGRFHVQSHFSPESLHLIRQILKVTPSERYSFQEIWEHPWIQAFARAEKQKCLMYDNGEWRAINLTGDKSDSSLRWFHQPVCRSEPVQMEVPIRISRLSRVAQFTRKKFIKFRKLMLCRG